MGSTDMVRMSSISEEFPNHARRPRTSEFCECSRESAGQEKPDRGLEPDLTVEWLPALRGFARSLTCNPTDADDLVQETLLKAIRNQEKFRSGTNLRAWLFAIMRNTFYNDVAKRKREITGMEDCISGGASVPATQEWEMRGKEVISAVKRLPLHYREAFILVIMLGESYQNSARICGLRMGTLKSRVNRARKLVIEMLEGEPINDGPK